MGGAVTRRLRFRDGRGTIADMGREIRDLSLVAALAAMLSAAPVTVNAKEPLRLAPSSKWLVNYAEDSCRMARSFGEGDQRVMLIADRYEPGEILRIALYGKPATASEDGEVRLRFGPAEATQKVAFYPATIGDKTPGIVLRPGVRIAPLTKEEEKAEAAARKDDNFVYAVADIGPAREAAVTFIEVLGRVRTPFILETGSLGPPLAALRKCTDELLDHWGIDVAKHTGLTRRATPKGNPAHWMTSDDYPPTMRNLGKLAIVQFRLNIDAKGDPTACHIQQSTRPQAFDDAVCKAIMRNARFEPALDAEGAPLASYWINTVVFQIM